VIFVFLAFAQILLFLNHFSEFVSCLTFVFSSITYSCFVSHSFAVVVHWRLIIVLDLIFLKNSFVCLACHCYH